MSGTLVSMTTFLLNAIDIRNVEKGIFFTNAFNKVTYSSLIHLDSDDQREDLQQHSVTPGLHWQEHQIPPHQEERNNTQVWLAQESRLVSWVLSLAEEELQELLWSGEGGVSDPGVQMVCSYRQTVQTDPYQPQLSILLWWIWRGRLNTKQYFIQGKQFLRIFNKNNAMMVVNNTILSQMFELKSSVRRSRKSVPQPSVLVRVFMHQMFSSKPSHANNYG